jgi:hypothetical protein
MNEIEKKVKIFRRLFVGLPHVYGTYDPVSGRGLQVKAQVTDKVIADHISGQRPYGVYLLVHDKTRAIAVDFDTHDKFAPTKFVSRAKHYKIPAHIERSKSKGYHVWIFFDEMGVNAKKARAVVRNILVEIEEPETEVFPKQDILTSNLRYGNFINAPLFGKLVSQAKTVFIDPYTFKPYSNQWEFLGSIHRINESVLDKVIELTNLLPGKTHQYPKSRSKIQNEHRYSLPPCAQKMLSDGVSRYQRVSCFRLAVHLKRLGLPFDLAVAALKAWALKNRPTHSDMIITEPEIVEQAKCAFYKDYRSFGCDSEAVQPFCQPDCPLNKDNMLS